MIAELLFLLPLSINTALTGRLYNLEGEDTGKALLYRTIRTGFWICFCLMLIGLAGSLLIPAVYGKSYSGAVAVTMILLPGVLFASIPKLASPWFFSSGRPGIPMRITLATLLINIILNYLFIPQYGIRGAAFASTISYLVYGLTYLVELCSKASFSLRALLLPDKTDLAILSKLLKR
jgi:O-antigen/teichoic acid export membrane protein